jgi:type II secretion system protein H
LVNVRARVHNRSGFTLLELMIVVVLIGVMTGVILAEMRGTFEDALLRTTARKLIAAANYANARAIARGEPHLLTIDLRAHRFSVHHNTRGDSGSRQVVEEEGTLDERIKIELREAARPRTSDEEIEPLASPENESEPHVIRFLPDGTAEAREILLRDRTGAELLLRVSQAIGRLKPVEAGRE